MFSNDLVANRGARIQTACVFPMKAYHVIKGVWRQRTAVATEQSTAEAHLRPPAPAWVSSCAEYLILKAEGIMAIHRNSIDRCIWSPVSSLGRQC